MPLMERAEGIADEDWQLISGATRSSICMELPSNESVLSLS